MKHGEILCAYCGLPAVFQPRSDHLYRRDYGPIWECKACNAWVGCHRGTKTPLGRLANGQLRKAKMAAHDAFDATWKRGEYKRFQHRGMAYKWLSEAMGISQAECHIGMFDEAQCARVVEVVKQLLAEVQP